MRGRLRREAGRQVKGKEVKVGLVGRNIKSNRLLKVLFTGNVHDISIFTNMSRLSLIYVRFLSAYLSDFESIINILLIMRLSFPC